MEQQGIRLHARYPRILAAYGAWMGAGAVLLLLGSKQWLLGFILSGLTVGMVVFGIRGSKMSEKIYRRSDLLLQWLILVPPVGFVALFILLLGRFITPLLGYLIGYFLVLLVIAVLAGRELLRGKPADKPPTRLAEL